MAEKLTLRKAFRQNILPPLQTAGFRDYTDSYGGTHLQVTRASCVKPYPDRLLVAVQFIDTRASGGNLLCRFWLVPWNHADDALERLQVGLCLIAFDAYEFSEEAAAGIARRVLALDRLVPALREHVLAEVASPPLPSYRAEVYRAECRLVEAVMGGRDATLTEAWQALLSELAALPEEQLTSSIVTRRVRRLVREHQDVVARLAQEAQLPYELGTRAGPLAVEAYYLELLRRRTSP